MKIPVIKYTSINISIRLAIGAFQSSPLESIRNLAFEPPLSKDK